MLMGHWFARAWELRDVPIPPATVVCFIVATSFCVALIGVPTNDWQLSSKDSDQRLNARLILAGLLVTGLFLLYAPLTSVVLTAVLAVVASMFLLANLWRLVSVAVTGKPDGLSLTAMSERMEARREALVGNRSISPAAPPTAARGISKAGER